MSASEEQLYVASLSPEEKRELAREMRGMPIWLPFEGPQEQAMECEADVLFYGGAAGGGKTDMAIGLALTQHRKSIIFRREATQLTGIIDRMQEILKTKKGYNGADKIWRLPERQVEFGSTPDPGDETKYQGRPHDLIFFDEISNFLELQFRFLMGWLRTTVPGQRCRVVCAGNPPTTSDGDWVRQYWGPWLDRNHPDKAEPGALRWYITLDGHDTPVEDGTPLILEKGEFRAATFAEIADPLSGVVYPQSRTFIPSRITDNPYLVSTNYVATLQAMPEPLRSQMLYGDFSAGVGDDAWQVIPSAWVYAAQDRWKEHPAHQALRIGDPRGRRDIVGYDPTMTSMGVDVSRGGEDESVVYCCYDNEWFDEPETFPGKAVPDGPTLGTEVLRVRRDGCPVHVDAIGIGASVVDFLTDQHIQVEPVTGNEKSVARDETGSFQFKNQRAELWWLLRERLDPKNHPTLCLPPHSQMTADLCAPRFTVRDGNVIQVESKQDIKKRLGRSPDHGDAVVYASMETPTFERRGFPSNPFNTTRQVGRVKRNLTCLRQPTRS